MVDASVRARCQLGTPKDAENVRDAGAWRRHSHSNLREQQKVF